MQQLNQLAFLCLNLVASFQYFPTVTGEGLRGIHLKFTTYNSNLIPHFIQEPSVRQFNTEYGWKLYTISGSNANIMEWLSKKFNFTYSIADPVIDQAMIAKYGYYDVAINKLEKNGIDGLMAALIVNPERAQKADFTSMAWSEPYTIVAPKPEQESRLFAFIRPFQPTVWLYLALSVIVIVAIISWFSFIFDRQPTKPVNQNDQLEKEKKISKIEKVSDTISYYVVYVINILTNHGIYIPYAQQSFRILAAAWLLAAVVLVNSYSSIIVSSLTVPALKPPVNSFEDLANHHRDVSVILSTDVVLSKIILNATTGIFKRLGDQARENPKDRVQTNSLLLFKKLETGHFGYPFIDSFNRYFIGQQYKKDGKCRFRMSPPLQFSSGYFNFFVKKNFPHTSILSWGLSYLWETGLVRHWVINSMPKAEECFDQHTKKIPKTIQKVNPIKLEDLVSAFLILGIGIGFGCFTFLLELIIKFKM